MPLQASLGEISNPSFLVSNRPDLTSILSQGNFPLSELPMASPVVRKLSDRRSLAGMLSERSGQVKVGKSPVKSRFCRAVYQYRRETQKIGLTRKVV